MVIRSEDVVIKEIGIFLCILAGIFTVGDAVVHVELLEDVLCSGLDAVFGIMATDVELGLFCNFCKGGGRRLSNICTSSDIFD